MSDASVSEQCCNGNCVSCDNQGAIDNKDFWREFNSLFIQLVCLVEKAHLDCTYTTSDLRKAGKDVLCNGKKS